MFTLFFQKKAQRKKNSILKTFGYLQCKKFTHDITDYNITKIIFKHFLAHRFKIPLIAVVPNNSISNVCFLTDTQVKKIIRIAHMFREPLQWSVLWDHYSMCPQLN